MSSVEETTNIVEKCMENGHICSSESNNSREGNVILSVPVFKTLDSTMLPRYCAILTRNEEEGIKFEDLKGLQNDLEALLTRVVSNARVLQKVIAILDNLTENSGESDLIKRKLMPVEDSQPDKSPVKTSDLKSLHDYKNNKVAFTNIMTDDEMISHANASTVFPSAFFDPSTSNSSSNAPRNDTQTKFWNYLQKYCRDIVNNDIHFLDKLILERQDVEKFQKVSKLGSREKFKKRSNDKSVNPESDKTMEKAGILGPLTQRFLSGFIEETNPIQSQDIIVETKYQQMTSDARAFSAGHASLLETCIKKELKKQGFLEQSKGNEIENEVLDELRKCQEELKLLSHNNVENLFKLRKLANDKKVMQKLKRKLEDVDKKVMNIQRKITETKRKKKVPSTEDIEQVWKCLKERENIIIQMENM